MSAALLSVDAVAGCAAFVDASPAGGVVTQPANAIADTKMLNRFLIPAFIELRFDVDVPHAASSIAGQIFI